MGGKPSLILSNPPLLLGGSDVVQDIDFMKRSKVKAVLSVCSTACKLRGIKLLHIDIADRGDVDIAKHFPEAIAFIGRNREQGRGVYVHCAAGISRSTTMVAAYLMNNLAISLTEALGHIQRCRETACPNKSFRKQLADFEHTLSKETGADKTVDEVAARDLVEVGDVLVKFKDNAKAMAQASFVFASNGQPVPADLESKLYDDGDGNGLKVLVDDRPKMVRKMSDYIKSDSEGEPNFAIGHTFEEQKRRLRERLRPLLKKGIFPDEKLGLRWLLQDGDAELLREATAKSGSDKINASGNGMNKSDGTSAQTNKICTKITKIGNDNATTKIANTTAAYVVTTDKKSKIHSTTASSADISPTKIKHKSTTITSKTDNNTKTFNAPITAVENTANITTTATTTTSTISAATTTPASSSTTSSCKTTPTTTTTTITTTPTTTTTKTGITATSTTTLTSTSTTTTTTTILTTRRALPLTPHQPPIGSGFGDVNVVVPAGATTGALLLSNGYCVSSTAIHTLGVEAMVRMGSYSQKLIPNTLLVECGDDSETDLLSLLDEVVEFVAVNIREGKHVWVHCGAGISRSASACVAFLMRDRDISSHDALKIVKKARRCAQPNDHFMKQLALFGQQKQN